MRKKIVNKKNRTKIPTEIATEILFLSDRTCCVCNIRGKNVQIHHIDENPSNNDIKNLSVLCLECHNDTMIKGGFGRKLDANQVIKYRNEWLERVQKRKEKADDIASIQSVTGSTENIVVENVLDDEFKDYKVYENPNILSEYLIKINIIKKAQLQIAQTKWDTGITGTMNQGNYDMVDFYEEVLVELSNFYPKGHFDKKAPKEYFREIISSRFSLHYNILEPDGAGNNGTIVSTLAGGNVMEDLKQLILNMVGALMFGHINEQTFDYNKWKKEWLA